MPVDTRALEPLRRGSGAGDAADAATGSAAAGAAACRARARASTRRRASGAPIRGARSRGAGLNVDRQDSLSARPSVSARDVFGIDTDLQVPAFARARRARARDRPGLPLQPRRHAGDPGRLHARPARDGARPARHRQVHPHRAGRGAAELALRARQSRRPHQPARPGRQGRGGAARRPAGHRVPGRHRAVGAAAPGRADLRRIRRRPARRDVRDPAHARARRQVHADGPEPGDAPHPYFRLFATANTVGPRQPQRPVPRRAAAQPCADRPLEHRRLAELPAAAGGGRDRAGAGARAVPTATARSWSLRWSRWRTSPASGFARRRPVDADVAAHGDHLGREHRDLPRRRRWPSGSPSSTSATRPNDRSSPNTSSAASIANSTRPRSASDERTRPRSGASRACASCAPRPSAH